MCSFNKFPGVEGHPEPTQTIGALDSRLWRINLEAPQSAPVKEKYLSIIFYEGAKIEICLDLQKLFGPTLEPLPDDDNPTSNAPIKLDLRPLCKDILGLGKGRNHDKSM